MINIATFKATRFITRVFLALGLGTAMLEAFRRVILFDIQGQITMSIIAVIFGLLWGILASMQIVVGVDELFLEKKNATHIPE